MYIYVIKYMAAVPASISRNRVSASKRHIIILIIDNRIPITEYRIFGEKRKKRIIYFVETGQFIRLNNPNRLSPTAHVRVRTYFNVGLPNQSSRRRLKKKSRKTIPCNLVHPMTFNPNHNSNWLTCQLHFKWLWGDRAEHSAMARILPPPE